MDSALFDNSKAAYNVFKNNMDLFFNPEIERRKQLNTLPENFVLFAAQAIFFPDGRPYIVRLNEEVSVEVKLKEGINRTHSSFWPELKEVEYVKLNEKDFSNCGHSTLILFKDGYQLTFDFRYNKLLCIEYLKVAKEFLDASNFTLDKNYVFAFIDNAFSTIELLAKTDLLLQANKSILGKTSHKIISTEFNYRYKHSKSDFEIERRKAFNKLSGIRTKARYLEGNVSIASKELLSIKNTIEHMYILLCDRLEFDSQIN
ncbi:MAG TPA: hypothetical protein PLP88_05480 [Bacteroidales bacterium]|nr:hypothetical protein [Bacteroidales bacterium]